MEREATLKVFLMFVSEESLNAEKIVFVNKVSVYIEQNGYVENPTKLTKPAFDKPQSFIRLFDAGKQ